MMFDLKTILLIIGLYYILSPIYENLGSDFSHRGYLNYIQSGVDKFMKGVENFENNIEPVVNFHENFNGGGASDWHSSFNTDITKVSESNLQAALPGSSNLAGFGEQN